MGFEREEKRREERRRGEEAIENGFDVEAKDLIVNFFRFFPKKKKQNFFFSLLQKMYHHTESERWEKWKIIKIQIYHYHTLLFFLDLLNHGQIAPSS